MKRAVINRIPLILFLLIYFAFSFRTYSSFGATLDEYFVYRRGEYFYTKIRGNDEVLKRSFAVRGTDNENLLYYNSTYPALLYIFNEHSSYEHYHLLNMLTASFLFITIYEVVLLLYSSPILSTVGSLILLATPRIFGHIPANPKDIPFATIYLLTLFTIYLAHSLKTQVRILLLGFLIGVAISLRIVGASLLGIFFLYRIYEIFSVKKSNRKAECINLILNTLIIFCIALFILFISLPYAASDPLNNIAELLRVGRAYPWKGEVLFTGRLISASNLPWDYLLKLIVITTPPVFLLFAFFGIIIPTNHKTIRFRNLILISLGIHLLLYLAMRPVLYNGIRHYLFLIPHIVLLSILGLREIFQKYKKTTVLTTLVMAAFVFQWGAIMRFYTFFHPYEYLYYNVFTGNLQGAYGRYELDYWGATDREQTLWLKEYIQKNALEHPRVSSCSTTFAVRYYYPEIIDTNPTPQESDFIICNDYRLREYISEKYPGKIIYTLYRDKIPLGFVYELDQKTKKAHSTL